MYVTESSSQFDITDADVIAGEHRLIFSAPALQSASIFANVSVSGVAKTHILDDCVELLISPYSYDPPNNYHAAAWLWGSGFVEADQFNSSTERRWVGDFSYPNHGWQIWAKTGLDPALSDADTVVNVGIGALLRDFTVPNKISPLVTMPPFQAVVSGAPVTHAAGALAFPSPSPQRFEGTRIWRSNRYTMALPGTATDYDFAILRGSPWHNIAHDLVAGGAMTNFLETALWDNSTGIIAQSSVVSPKLIAQNLSVGAPPLVCPNIQIVGQHNTGSGVNVTLQIEAGYYGR